MWIKGGKIMAKTCSVCRNKISLGTASKAIDGILCVNCLMLANGSIMTRNVPKNIEEQLTKDFKELFYFKYLIIIK